MKNINDVSKETLDVLEYFNDEFNSKIPDKVRIKLEEFAARSNEKKVLDVSKRLDEQDISEECKCLISLIYYDYVAREEERKELLGIWNENERLYQEELSKTFNMEDIFKNNKEKSAAKIELKDGDEENLPAVTKGDNIFKRIWRLIKKWLRIEE